jgi:hypothetical protein
VQVFGIKSSSYGSSAARQRLDEPSSIVKTIFSAPTVRSAPVPVLFLRMKLSAFRILQNLPLFSERFALSLFVLKSVFAA